jgi:hypothetical protein
MARCVAILASKKQCSRNAKGNLCWQHSAKGEKKVISTKREKKVAPVKVKVASVKKVVPKKGMKKVVSKRVSKTKVSNDIQKKISKVDLPSDQTKVLNEWFTYTTSFLQSTVIGKNRIMVTADLFPNTKKWDSQLIQQINNAIKHKHFEWAHVGIMVDSDGCSVHLGAFYNYIMRDIDAKTRAKLGIPMDRFKGLMTRMMCNILSQLIKSKLIIRECKFTIEASGIIKGEVFNIEKLAQYYTKTFGVKEVNREENEGIVGLIYLEAPVSDVIDKCSNS